MTKKVHATLHLLSSSIFIFVFIVGVFSVPLSFLLEPLGFNAHYFGIFLSGLLTIAAVYFVANSKLTFQGDPPLKKLLKFLVMFPLFLSLSMGLSLHNSIAVVQGYLGKKSPFVRTPKFNIRSIKDSLMPGSKYLAQKIPVTTILEGLLALYFLCAIVASVYFNDTTFIVFHILLTFGYGSICYYSVRHHRLKNS